MQTVLPVYRAILSQLPTTKYRHELCQVDSLFRREKERDQYLSLALGEVVSNSSCRSGAHDGREPFNPKIVQLATSLLMAANDSKKNFKDAHLYCAMEEREMGKLSTGAGWYFIFYAFSFVFVTVMVLKPILKYNCQQLTKEKIMYRLSSKSSTKSDRLPGVPWTAANANRQTKFPQDNESMKAKTALSKHSSDISVRMDIAEEIAEDLEEEREQEEAIGEELGLASHLPPPVGEPHLHPTSQKRSTTQPTGIQSNTTEQNSSFVKPSTPSIAQVPEVPPGDVQSANFKPDGPPEAGTKPVQKPPKRKVTFGIPKS